MRLPARLIRGGKPPPVSAANQPAIAASYAAVRANAFAAAAALPEEGPELDTTLAALRAKLDAWGALLTRWAGTAHQAMARVEEERIETLAARHVVESRRALEDGTATAERSLRFLIEKHADSKNLPQHILRLGDFYADLARDYVSQHERPLAFEEDQFLARADRAWLARLITRREPPERFIAALHREPDDIKVVVQFSPLTA